MQKFTVSKFRRLVSEKWPPFLDFRELRPPLNNAPIFAKMVMSMEYALVGNRGDRAWRSI